MNCRNDSAAAADGKKKHTALDAARRAPAEDRTRLYLLSFLLTADRAKAEQCFVPGLDLAAEDNAALRDWAHSWARRIVIGNALRLIAPRSETHAREPLVKVQITEEHSSGAKARRFLSNICGTTEVVPFQNPTLTTGCQDADSERPR